MIRRAGRGDADAVAELFERSFGTLTFLPALHTLDEHREHFARVLREQEVWLFEADDRLLGFAALDGDVLGYLYVEPDAHARGVGTALFDHVKLRRPQGFEFWVFQENDNARRFYERRGARLIRMTDGAENEERVPDALYEWRPGVET